MVGFWSVSSKGPHSARPGFLLRAAGIKESVHFESLNALAREGKEGLAILDARLLSGRSGELVRSLKKSCPRLHLVVLCPESIFEGPELADALAAGALDFLRASRPDEELADAIRLHVKRLYPKALAGGSVRVQNIRIEKLSRRVFVRRGASWKETAELSPKEYGILLLLLNGGGGIVERRVLMDELWGGRSGSVNPETLDKHVGALRRKLGRDGAMIRTVRGVGYRLEKNYSSSSGG